MSPTPALFTPIKIGNMHLQHRIALAPMTRLRADDDHVPTDLLVEHYGQRASTTGSMLITEGTFIAPKAGGWLNVPGIWNDAQIGAWKKVLSISLTLRRWQMAHGMVSYPGYGRCARQG